MSTFIKVSALIFITLYFTACGGEGSGSSSPASKAIEPIAELPAPPTTTTTLPPATISSLAGSYTSGSSQLDILSDGSFSASTVQVLRTTSTVTGSSNHTSYSCTISGSIGQQLSNGAQATYQLVINSTSYYRPSNTGSLVYQSFGCIGAASSTVIAIEHLSASCMRVQNLGVVNTSSPDNGGLTYCK